MTLNKVTVTCDITDGQGNPILGGTGYWNPSVQVSDATDHMLIAPGVSIPVAFKSTGSPSVTLIADDNSATLPAGWRWVFTPPAGTGLASCTYDISYSNGGTQYLSALTPVSTAVSTFPLNPMTTAGDMITGGSSPAGIPERLGAGSGGQVLTVDSGTGLPAWTDPGASLPLTTLGDTVYEDATPAPARLAGNTSATKKFMTQTGTGSASAAPAWGTIAAADVPTSQLTAATAASRGVVTLGAQWPWQFQVDRLGSGSDDGANITAAIASAIAYALANQGYAEVLLPDATGPYLANTAPTVGGSFKGNAIIPVQPQSVTAVKPVIKLIGASPGAAHSLSHWQQQVPQAAGTVIATTRTDGTNDGTNGPAFVIGGPVNGYGGGTSLFSNACIVVDGITIQVPWNGTYGGFGFFGLAEAEVISASCMTDAVPVSGTSYPQMTYASITNQWPVGLQMPDTNNNDNANIGRWSAEGMFIGAQISEHTSFESIRAIYCLAGIQAGSWSGTPMPHGMQGLYYSAEVCDSAVVGLGATSKLNITQMDVESVSNAVYDPNNYVTGEIGLRVNGIPGYGTFPVNGASGMRLVALDCPRGVVASPQAVPSSTTALANLYYRDATVNVQPNGATVSAIAVDGTTLTGITSGLVSVPSGHSITLTYSGGTPAWQWVLS